MHDYSFRSIIALNRPIHLSHSTLTSPSHSHQNPVRVSSLRFLPFHNVSIISFQHQFDFFLT